MAGDLGNIDSSRQLGVVHTESGVNMGERGFLLPVGTNAGLAQMSLFPPRAGGLMPNPSLYYSNILAGNSPRFGDAVPSPTTFQPHGDLHASFPGPGSAIAIQRSAAVGPEGDVDIGSCSTSTGHSNSLKRKSSGDGESGDADERRRCPAAGVSEASRSYSPDVTSDRRSVSELEKVKNARAMRNREAASRSRQQQKEKRAYLENENERLLARVKELEREQESLVAQYELKFGIPPDSTLFQPDGTSASG
eukprot:CAMPEP_0184682398 /NCGR_PEP_ID=MMETSP0312-20130426/7120_1 /TAXON_ID=31354 /ORGANISM="Compsopogon coeruleus, Strain SAG 36.94" /LENGTH=249 /DNA_ID=CAMNT_0027134029 /DNA_START=48 /DNA_END=797 /DNA_ORIENTATION=-